MRVPSPKPPWRPPLRRAGPGVAEPLGGDGGRGERGRLPPAALGACVPASPARLLRSPSPGSPGGGGESRRGVSAAAVLRPREHCRVPTCPGSPPHPGDLRRPPPWLSLHPPTRSPPRGLGATARDVQTQLSARARDSRIAFGQSVAKLLSSGPRSPAGFRFAPVKHRTRSPELRGPRRRSAVAAHPAVRWTSKHADPDPAWGYPSPPACVSFDRGPGSLE